MSNTWITCLDAWDNPSKDGLIPDKTTGSSLPGVKGGLCSCKLSHLERSAAYQLVGEERLTKAKTGSWSERMVSHTGTETRPRVLRDAAVRNIAQWRKL